MNIQEIESKIVELEAEWKIYHHAPRENDMPDMVQLVKLRILRKEYVQ